jgi:hypothetical protein
MWNNAVQLQQVLNKHFNIQPCNREKVHNSTTEQIWQPKDVLSPDPLHNPITILQYDDSTMHCLM